MTDKEQIICHGVGVSKCEHFSGCKRKECMAVWASPGYKELHKLKCCDSPNCYFRQLARKTQECENLEKEICNIRMGVNGNIQPTVFGKSLDEIHKILTGHARYRKALEAFQDDYFKGLDTTTIAELAKKSIRLTTENRKLEQECEELKEKQKIIGKAIYKESIELCNENARYLKALEEIEKIAKLTKEGYMGPYYGLDEILKNISKVKKEGK